ncbi:LytTR family DNA-binding domain-containing protein, partial [Lacticaseibacillus paracasei]
LSRWYVMQTPFLARTDRSFFTFFWVVTLIMQSRDELLYIQTTPGISGTLELHAEREIATFPGNLKEVSLQYPTLFRCHRSILLNPTHISKLDTHGRFVYMDNQDKLEVSIRRVSALRQVMMTANKPQSATNDLSNDA